MGVKSLLSLNSKKTEFQGSRGQAFIETCLVLPLTFAWVTLVIFGGYLTLCYFLVDYWVYKGAFCLSSEKSIYFCRREMEKNLEKLFFVQWRFETILKTQDKVSVCLYIKNPYMGGFKFFTSLPRPLSSKNFSGVSR